MSSGSRPFRLLVIAHGHPALSRGGGEHAANALHRHFQRQEGVESRFLAAAEDEHLAYGCSIGSIDDGQGGRDLLIRRSGCHFFHPSAVDLSDAGDLAHWVRTWQPDAVHLHHFIHVGLDLITALRHWLPNSRIVLTLHEFLSICPYNGQLRRRDGLPCGGPSSHGCRQCLPERSATDLLLRDQMIRLALARVDHLISPSLYLAERLRQEGIGLRTTAMAGKAMPEISVIDNLLGLPLAPVPPAPAPRIAPALRLGYFGQITPFKGLDLILEALELVVHSNAGPVVLTIHGTDLQQLEHWPEDWQACRQQIRKGLKRLAGHVVVHGPYGQGQIPQLMAEVDWVVMGSRWPENSPVVIQEALACGRPLLVPGFGGMAEKVLHGVQGLHYTPGSAVALAEVIHRCLQDRQLQPALAANCYRSPDRDAQLAAMHWRVYRNEALPLGPGITPVGVIPPGPVAVAPTPAGPTAADRSRDAASGRGSAAAMPVDVLIPVGAKDRELLAVVVAAVRRHLRGHRRILLVSADRQDQRWCRDPQVEWIDEREFPPGSEALAQILGADTALGWWWQQLIKLQAQRLLPELADHLLVLDSETVLLRPVRFLDGQGRSLLHPASEDNPTYRNHRQRLLPDLLCQTSGLSGITHCMLFDRRILEQLHTQVEAIHGVPLWQAFLSQVDPLHRRQGGASEYDLYFHYALQFAPQLVRLRSLPWKVSGDLDELHRRDQAYITFHRHMREQWQQHLLGYQAWQRRQEGWIAKLDPSECRSISSQAASPAPPAG